MSAERGDNTGDNTDERMDLLETLAGAGLAAPPLGSVKPREVANYGRWSWGTRHLDEGALYMFEVDTVLRELLDGGPFFALAHAGHGLNSYGLNLVTARGPIAAFVQHAWGGVYTDPLQAALRIGNTYARLHALFDRIAEPGAQLRWVLLYSDFRGTAGIVDVARYRHSGSIADSLVDLHYHGSADRPDEAHLFEFFVAQPGLLEAPMNREYSWADSPHSASALGEPGSGDEDAVIDAETERAAWRCAAGYVGTWPDLLMSWYDWYEGVQPHFVLHRDVLGGGALHFDSDEHALWVSPDGSERAVDWSHVRGKGIHIPWDFDPFAAWGDSEALEGPSSRAIAYGVIHDVLEVGSAEETLVVRPAKLLAREGEPSAYDLRDEFPTLVPTINWYTDLVSVEFRRRTREGTQAYWHEPLWVISDSRTDLLVVDEGGRAHIRNTDYDLSRLVTELGSVADVAASLLSAARSAAAATTGSASSLGGPPPALRSADPTAPLARRADRTLGPSIGGGRQSRTAPPTLAVRQLDRAAGAIVGMAVGDALGSQYEFGPSRPDDFVPEFGVGVFGHDAGEWTDDTAMAIPLLEAIANGESLRDPDVLADRVLAHWLDWAAGAKDVGAQTRAVLDRLSHTSTEADARAAARSLHDTTGKSAGNGSLMRIAPVALGYLGEGQQGHLVEAVSRVTRLTHWEPSNIEAAALWSLLIRQAVLTGDVDPWEQRNHLVESAEGLDGAELIRGGWEGHPRDFSAQNGWVVKAFQAALVAVRGASTFREAVIRAIQGGGDTDTVAAIAGALAGAKWGLSQIPLSWQRRIFGWPGYNANDLVRLAILAARQGTVDSAGWPAAESVLNKAFLHTAPVRHPADSGVWLGSQSALASLPESISAVVSLSRLGTSEAPTGRESLRVWLIDSDGENANLNSTLADAADAIAELRAEGKEVFVHCAEARSRTAAVAALYAALHRGIPLDVAWAMLDGRHANGVLPYFDPAPFLRDAVAGIVTARETP